MSTSLVHTTRKLQNSSSSPEQKTFRSQPTQTRSFMYRIAVLNHNKDGIFFTDGSVDQVTQHACAGVHLKSLTSQNNDVSIRVRNGASTLQTELLASNLALLLAVLRHLTRIVIHTDSLSSLQTLQTHWPSDNKNLITTARKLCSHLITSGITVIFHWIPSHVGIAGNELADRLARQATKLPQVKIRSLKKSRS